MSTFMEIVKALVMAFIVTVIVAAIVAFPTMWLWNWLMPDIFELTKINVWQALGINLLCGILFSHQSSNNNKNNK